MARGARTRGLLVMAVLGAAVAAGSGSTAPAQPGAKAPYRLEVDAVAYHLPGKTSLGIPARRGVVAVDPDVIALGTKLFVPGYGRSVAADTGTAIKGNVIDLWFPSTAQARKWGRRTLTITVYG